MAEAGQWRRCSACKNPIALGATYWACNVSTCNRKRTALAFCSVSCWEVHLPGANHRESWAVEKAAPTHAESPPAGAPSEKRAEPRLLRSEPVAPPTGKATGEAPTDVLIIASRLKEYISARSGFNTSDRVLQPLSEIVRRACDQAIQNAIRAERKTVLDRDVPDA